MNWVKHDRTRILASFLLLVMWVAGAPEYALGQPASASSSIMVPFYAAPKDMDLCSEPVPLGVQDVYERFDREFTTVVYSHAQVYLWLKRMHRYFPWIEKQLAAKNLPDDLKFVAVAESDLIISASSPAGAVGPWQFISSTGRNYGLDQRDAIDERYDFELSTASAFRYLKDLHGMFQNWTLAIAAYNCGEKRVMDETRRQNVREYYSLKLPLETERYILRILAIKEVLSHPQRYGYCLPEGAGYPEIPVDQVNVRLIYPMGVRAIADAAGMTYRELRIMNPSIISDTVPAGMYSLKVHKGKGKDLENNLAAGRPTYPSTTSVTRTVYHKVGKGDTLSSIARDHGVSVEDLRSWNDIKGGDIQVGQTLRIQR